MARRFGLLRFFSRPGRRPVLQLRARDAAGRILDWWTHLDSNQGPLACEASALTGLSYASTGEPDYRAARACPQDPYGRRDVWKVV